MILKIPTLLLKAQAIQGRKTTKCSVKDKKMSVLVLQKVKSQFLNKRPKEGREGESLEFIAFFYIYNSDSDNMP